MMRGDDPEPEDDWELVAMVKADGTERPVDSAAPGGVETVTTEVLYGGTDPPD
jgi:hypothetical protein